MGETATGAAWAEQVAATDPGDDRVALWWLGHSGLVLRWRQLTVCCDPYLSNHLSTLRGETWQRRMTAPCHATDLSFCDLILISHQHPDHFDPLTVPALLAASPHALLVLPAALADYAADELGVADERLVPIRDGEFFEHEELRLHAVAAAHDTLEVDPAGNHLNLSYVIQCPPVTLFVGGDTVPYLDQAQRIEPFRPQVALLPITGRDARRQALGMAGNLTPLEAIRLATEIGAERLVPVHWGMFDFTATDPETVSAAVAEHRPHLEVDVPELGQRWYYPSGR